MLRHIVVFKFHDNISESSRHEAVERLRQLCQQSSLLKDWRVEESLDRRKGYIVVQNTLLKQGVSIEKWRDTSKHKEVVEFMSGVADWLVADYEETT